MPFTSRSRRFPRTDRPGSGAYRGPVKEGLAFDDFRAVDEQEAQNRQHRPGLWARFARLLRLNRFRMRSENLLSAAAEALAREPTVETSRIKISVRGQALLVSGSVTSRWMKQRVSELLRELPGGETLKNELQIRPSHLKLPQEGDLVP